MERGTISDRVSLPTQYDPSTKTRYVEGLVESAGRWPANVILTDPIFDGGWEGVVGGGETSSGSGIAGTGSGDEAGLFGMRSVLQQTYGDSGTYSRFFLIPKADRTDREPVLRTDRELAFDDFNRNVGNTIAARRENYHPTVKPIDLMRHLVRLVTPAGGTVLDPFLGSGTTGLAAELEGFPWIGIEREAEYVAIAEARLNGTQRGMGL
jgi:site-specific DNA-methyltransferase (adenine-specific)